MVALQAELQWQKQHSESLQDALDNTRKLLSETDKQELQQHVHNLQNLLLYLKMPGNSGKDRTERDIDDAKLLDGFMPSVRDSLGEDFLSRGVQAECLQQTLVADALQVSLHFALLIIAQQYLDRSHFMLRCAHMIKCCS